MPRGVCAMSGVLVRFSFLIPHNSVWKKANPHGDFEKKLPLVVCDP
jgi:hypothetical protein